MSLIEISKVYFKNFSRKDLSGLEKMFSKEVSLRDWEIGATGINEVLKANKKIFESVDSIHVIPIRMYNDNNTVIAELKIDVNNGQEKILVVDIIEFDGAGKIIDIKAFKG
tara:strand:+ start:52 stop:384 length:333 start_codon:yes stop_codon:yes gene_type:complete